MVCVVVVHVEEEVLVKSVGCAGVSEVWRGVVWQGNVECVAGKGSKCGGSGGGGGGNGVAAARSL